MKASNSKKRQSNILRGFLIIVLYYLVGYSIILYFMDRADYQKGYQAYEQADCTGATLFFDKVIGRWRLFDLGDYTNQAQKEKAECIPFQAAADKQNAGDFKSAFTSYVNFVQNYSSSVLASAAIDRGSSLFGQASASDLASIEACLNINFILQTDIIPQPEVNLPQFYIACGRIYTEAGNTSSSFPFYVALLTEYPGDALANEAESALFANPAACDQIDFLKANSIVSSRVDFLPKLYFSCGQQYEKDSDWPNAIKIYEFFLANYQDHSLLQDVETALASAIVAQAKSTGASEIPPPSVSGKTGTEYTEVIIQNDSPEPLRIVFSGTKSLVEELEACGSCQTYALLGPQYCPELGPIGHYALPAGDYEVVVETIGGNKVTPWIGSWSLSSGDEYYNCFFIVTTGLP